MPARAAGLRARPSAAAAVALAWAKPQTAEAIAMENPAVMATQLTALAASPPCAKTGTARNIQASAMNRQLSLRIVFLLVSMNCRQWVVDVILVQTPSRLRLATVKSNALPPLLPPGTRSSA